MVQRKLIIGDTFKAEFSYEPPEGFALSFRINGPAGEEATTRVFTVTEGVATIPAVTTATFLPGLYDWVLIRLSDDETFTVESGTLSAIVRADLRTNQEKSHARKTLEAIEAVLEDRATLTQQSYSIKDRSLSRHSLAELLELRKYYKELVLREQGKNRPRQIKPIFRAR